MTRLPALTARDLIGALKRMGFQAVRQRGSHVVLWNPASALQTTVPMHPGDLKRHLVFKILRDIDISADELRKYL